jgi:diadenosine tetraphosphate (Ap4A) HIT family hydrolase
MNNMTDCPMCHRWEREADLRIVELEHSFVTLNRDQFFPGYALLFTKQHVTELFHLDAAVRGTLMEEVARVAETLQRLFQPTKINYELLGNMVPHMHWHIIPRFNTDSLWPRPVWAEPHVELVLTPEEYTQRCVAIREALL